MLAMRPIEEKQKEYNFEEPEGMSDAEMDREWKASRRPQSQIARAFSVSLDDIFRMDSSLDKISQSVFDKQQMVIQQNRELEALEARLRETENRLKRQSRSISPSQASSALNSPTDNIFDSSNRRQQNQTPLSSPMEATHADAEQARNSKA